MTVPDRTLALSPSTSMVAEAKMNVDPCLSMELATMTIPDAGDDPAMQMAHHAFSSAFDSAIAIKTQSEIPGASKVWPTVTSPSHKTLWDRDFRSS